MTSSTSSSLTVAIDLTSSTNDKWLKRHSGIGFHILIQSENEPVTHLSAKSSSAGHQISPREVVADRVAEEHTTGKNVAATFSFLSSLPSSSYIPSPKSLPGSLPSNIAPWQDSNVTPAGEVMVFPTHPAFSPFPDTLNPYIGAVIFEGFLYGLYTTLFFICAYVLIRRHHRLSQRDAAEREKFQLQSSSRQNLHSTSPNNHGSNPSPNYSTHNFSPVSANYSQSQTPFMPASNQTRNVNNYTPPRSAPTTPSHLPWIWVLLASGLLMYLIATADMIYTLVLLFRELLGPERKLTFEEIRIKYWLFVTNNMIADSLLLYRCYVVWTWRKSIVVGPGILLIAATVVGYIFEGSNSSLFGKTWVYLTLIFVLNVLLTGLTAGRIWYLAHKAHAILRPGLLRRYNATIAILVESGVIYSAYILLNLGFNRNKVANIILDAGFIQIVGIMPTLIIVQVGVGRAVHDFETSEGAVNMNPSRFDDDRDVPGHNEMETFDRTAQTFRSLRTGLKTSQAVDHEIDLEVGEGSHRTSRGINRRPLMLQQVSGNRKSHLSVESAYKGLGHGRHSRSSGEDDIYDTPLATPTTPTIKLGHVDGDGQTPHRGIHHTFNHNPCTCRGTEDRYASHETFVVCRLHPGRYHSRNFSDGGSMSAFGGATMIAGSSTPNLRSDKSFKTADMGTAGTRNSFISRLGLPEFVVDDEHDRHYNDPITQADHSSQPNGLGLSNLGVEKLQVPVGVIVSEPEELGMVGVAISEDIQESQDQERPRSGYVQGEGSEYALMYDRLRPPSSHSRGSRSPGPVIIQLEATSSSETQRPIHYNNPPITNAGTRSEETDEDDMDIVDFESARSQLPPSSALFEGTGADWSDVRSSLARPRSSGSRPSTSRNVSDSTTLSTDIYVEAPSRPISGTGSGPDMAVTQNV